MIIAIDGPSGTGKSTVAKGVAKRLGFTFFDTGAMYRSVAWKVLQEGIDPKDPEKVRELMSRFRVHIQSERGEKRYFVDGVEITQAIREPRISSVASQVAVYPEVRATLVVIQRNFGHRCNAVFEGRDMGTVVFPDADLKIFLSARPEVRAERRYRELLAKFPEKTGHLHQEEILKDMEERDKNDSTRTISPLRQAKDAIFIDTSDLSANEVIEKVIQLKATKKEKLAPMKLSYEIVHTFARLFFKLFFRLKVYGLEHIQKGAGVFAANHASFYDPPILSASCPEEIHFLAKESLFRIPLLGRLIRMLNTHPLSGNATDASTFRLMIKLLSEGKKMILFPEGSRTFDGEMQPLQRGLPFLIQRAKVAIYPVYLVGTFEAWPRARRFPRFFGKMRCIFGSPIQFEEFAHLEKKAAEKEILERTESAIRALKHWYETGAQGSPP